REGPRQSATPCCRATSDGQSGLGSATRPRVRTCLITEKRGAGSTEERASESPYSSSPLDSIPQRGTTMTYFTPVEPDAASGKAADLLTQVQKTLGSTPNMTKVMANSPTLLKSYLALFGAVASGTIPAAVRARL